MKTSVVRKKYLEFMQSKGHVIVPSSGLVPENDPTTLFTGSGMQPMIQYLLGAKHPLYAYTTAEAQKNIKKISLQDIKQLHKKILTSAELFLTITGNIQDDTLSILNKKFSKLLTNSAQAIPIAHPKKRANKKYSHSIHTK